MEFALILPIVVSILIAIIDFGTFLHRYIAVQTAVREGIRAASSDNLADKQIRAIVVRAAEGLGLSTQNVRIVRKPLDPAMNDLDTGGSQTFSLRDRLGSYETIEVRVETRHPFILPFWAQLQGDPTIVGSVKTLLVTR